MAKMYRRSFIAAAAATLLGRGAFAQTRQPSLPIAIKGYDPVAYFTDGKPVRGAADITHDWDGLRYQFASREHRDSFIANPDKYAPQYSGYCTAGMSHGLKIEAQPENWVISDGRLYIFSTVMPPEQWANERKEMVVNADRRWAELKGPKK